MARATGEAPILIAGGGIGGLAAGEMRRHRDAVLIVANDLTGVARVNQRAVAAGF